MKALIELYDERPIENVLGTEMFHPQELLLLCPGELAATPSYKASLEEYFAYRKVDVKVKLIPTDMLDAGKVENKLREIIRRYGGCAIDISGGTDAALFAAGLVSGGENVSVFTYSRKKNCFFEILNAPFARDIPCRVTLDTLSCFLMAGGKLLKGRTDNNTLRSRLKDIDRLFSIFTQYRRIWRRQIGYIQQISSSEHGDLHAEGNLTVRVDHGNVTADMGLIHELAKAGLILDLAVEGERIRFHFPDETVRFWLRDIGAVLELQVYRSCIAADVFDDVVLSAIVNWEGGTSQRNAVTNEIDVVAVRGVCPMFISCKTSEVRTEALNELAVLRERFGGKLSRAMIVTSAPPSGSRPLMRMRAAELGIELVEWNDLSTDSLVKILRRGKVRQKKALQKELGGAVNSNGRGLEKNCGLHGRDPGESRGLHGRDPEESRGLHGRDPDGNWHVSG